jgi:hypothetical protein
VGIPTGKKFRRVDGFGEIKSDGEFLVAIPRRTAGVERRVLIHMHAHSATFAEPPGANDAGQCGCWFLLIARSAFGQWLSFDDGAPAPLPCKPTALHVGELCLPLWSKLRRGPMAHART